MKHAFWAIIVVLWLIWGMGPARAHTPPPELQEQAYELLEEARTEGISPELIDRWVQLLDGWDWHHPSPPPRVPSARTNPQKPAPAVTAGVEQWRPLVAAYFPADQVDRALCIMGHESRGDPTATNPSSGAAGLFQHLPKYWADRSSKAGWAGANIYDPTANTAVAAWLQATGGWTHWSPYNRGLCR